MIGFASGCCYFSCIEIAGVGDGTSASSRCSTLSIPPSGLACPEARLQGLPHIPRPRVYRQKRMRFSDLLHGEPDFSVSSLVISRLGFCRKRICFSPRGGQMSYRGKGCSQQRGLIQSRGKVGPKILNRSFYRNGERKRNEGFSKADSFTPDSSCPGVSAFLPRLCPPPPYIPFIAGSGNQ